MARYIYSTATLDIAISEYSRPPNIKVLPRIVRSVLIKGGANCPNKNLVTMSGIVTKVSDDDYAWLMKQPKFLESIAKGFFRVEAFEANVDTVVNDMQPGDGARPFTVADYEKGGRAAESGSLLKAPKVGALTA